jgi:hypothetical protein
MKLINRYTYITLLLAIITLASACKKEEEEIVPYAEETPYYGFLAGLISNTIIQEFFWEPSMSQEIGYVFTPLANGRITAFEAKLPFVYGNLSVSIWDYDTQALIRTEQLNMMLANTIIKKNIAAINLQANKKYVISMNTNVWYRYQKTLEDGIVQYPYRAGNIRIDDYAIGGAGTFPSSNNPGNRYFEGDVAFSFLRVD